jgi:hypothetical protein
MKTLRKNNVRSRNEYNQKALTTTEGIDTTIDRIDRELTKVDEAHVSAGVEFPQIWTRQELKMQEIIESALRPIKRQLETIETEIDSIGEQIPTQSHTIFIQNLRHPVYQLRHPIPVLIETDEDVIIATHYDIDMYGTGDDVQEAISDLCAGIIEYYESLKDDEDNLGPLPAQEYAYLNQIIMEVEI